jgi:site-specific DNA recombinase
MSKLTIDDVPGVSSTLRCAVYVRTAVEIARGRGCADAQRELCAACIRSQLGGSWIASFEDLGFSGRSLKRPALQHLLADVAAGAIDTVVVARADRLSRSTRARAVLLARFQDAGVSLVVADGSTETLSIVEASAVARRGPTP